MTLVVSCALAGCQAGNAASPRNPQPSAAREVVAPLQNGAIAALRELAERCGNPPAFAATYVLERDGVAGTLTAASWRSQRAAYRVDVAGQSLLLHGDGAETIIQHVSEDGASRVARVSRAGVFDSLAKQAATAIRDGLNIELNQIRPPRLMMYLDIGEMSAVSHGFGVTGEYWEADGPQLAWLRSLQDPAYEFRVTGAAIHVTVRGAWSVQVSRITGFVESISTSAGDRVRLTHLDLAPADNIPALKLAGDASPDLAQVLWPNLVFTTARNVRDVVLTEVDARLRSSRMEWREESAQALATVLRTVYVAATREALRDEREDALRWIDDTCRWASAEAARARRVAPVDQGLLDQTTATLAQRSEEFAHRLQGRRGSVVSTHVTSRAVWPGTAAGLREWVDREDSRLLSDVVDEVFVSELQALAKRRVSESLRE